MKRTDDSALPGENKTSRAAAKAERRQNLIEATITSIARYGLSGTTLARVTEIAGVSMGLVNFHFETKERLLEAVLTHLADDQRTFWHRRNQDASLSTADRLMAIIDSRFHGRVSDRRSLAIWFAFWGDASAREIYRRVVGGVDEEILEATVAILTLMVQEGGYTNLDPLETALAMEAMYDGLRLNMLLYPEEFNSLNSRARALDFVAAILPCHFNATRGRS